MFETNPEVKRTFEKFRQLDTSTELWRSTVLETHGMVVMCPSVRQSVREHISETTRPIFAPVFFSRVRAVVMCTLDEIIAALDDDDEDVAEMIVEQRSAGRSIQLHIMSFVKPEVHRVSQRHQKTTDPR